MTQETTTAIEATKEQSLKDERRRQRKLIRVLMHFLPMAVGLVGLYLISTWSLDVREDYPEVEASAYYVGMALVLLAFQAPLWLEIYRRRTKRFMQWRVLMAMGIFVSLLAVAAHHIAPEVEYEWADD